VRVHVLATMRPITYVVLFAIEETSEQAKFSHMICS